MATLLLFQTKYNWSLALVDADVDSAGDTMWWPNVNVNVVVVVVVVVVVMTASPNWTSSQDTYEVVNQSSTNNSIK